MGVINVGVGLVFGGLFGIMVVEIKKMRYLFYDIECANSKDRKYYMFSFGYVLTDESFNILEKEDILINPNGVWDKYVLKAITKYKKGRLKNEPKFPQRYERIKELLTSKDVISYGFSVDNEIRYLNFECKRYGLDYIDVESVDIQYLHKNYYKLQEVTGLEKAYKQHGLLMGDLHAHNSSDDAEMTMAIYKNMLQLDNSLHSEFVAKYGANAIKHNAMCDDAQCATVSV